MWMFISVWARLHSSHLSILWVWRCNIDGINQSISVFLDSMFARVSFKNSFMTLLFVFNWQSYRCSTFYSEYSTCRYSAFLLCYIKVEDIASHLIAYYYKRSVSVSDKVFGIIYQSEYWIHVGQMAELRTITISLVHIYIFTCKTNNLCFVSF